MSSWSEGTNCVTKTLAEVEHTFFQLKFPCFNFGKIKHIVNHAEQCLSGLPYHGKILTLVVVQLGIKDQFGHPNDGVHRRTNLVTHIRKEITFRTIRTISYLFGIQDFPLGPFAGRDIVPDSHNAINDTVLVNEWHFGSKQPKIISRLCLVRFFTVKQ